MKLTGVCLQGPQQGTGQEISKRMAPAWPQAEGVSAAAPDLPEHG